jgi:hypothetical protein
LSERLIAAKLIEPVRVGSGIFFDAYKLHRALGRLGRRPGLRLRCAQLSELQRSRSRFRCRNAPKQPTQNTVVKKRARQLAVDSDYLFGNLVSVFLPLVQRVEAPSYSYPNNTFVLCSLSGDPICLPGVRLLP